MANKKRDKNTYVKRLGRYRLDRADLLAIEKILWVYADFCEMKHAGIDKLPDGRRHMPRAVVDRCASIGFYRPFHFTLGWGEFGINYADIDWIYREDSVKFLSKQGYPKRTRYLELAAWPGIKVIFTPLSTVIYAQTHYAKGRELKVMKKAVSEIERYLDESKLSFLNGCNINE